MRKSPLKFRKLSDEFRDDLIKADGILHPLLERVKQDNELMLAIRDECINIYYRCGNILELKKLKPRNKKGSYSPSFNPGYNNSGLLDPKLLEFIEKPKKIEDQNGIEEWLNIFEELKKVMRAWLETNKRHEKKFQQMIVRDNNANNSEYFITDIEYQEFQGGPKPDLLALRWLDSSQENICNLQPVLIEIKLGDEALEGDTGIIGHLKGFNDIIIDETRRDTLFRTIKSQFKQLGELGLIDLNKRFADCKNLEIILDKTPEIMFIFADHDSDNPKLGKELSNMKESPNFDLKFNNSWLSDFKSRKDGDYILRAENMVSLDNIIKLVTPN